MTTDNDRPDIRNIQQAALAAAFATEELRAAIDRMTDCFFMVDADWRLTFCNASAEDLYDISRSDDVGKTIWEVFPADFADELRRESGVPMEDGGSITYVQHAPNLDRWFEVRVFPTDRGVSVYARDITEQKNAEERLRTLALHDGLTGLPNRVLFDDRAEQALVAARRSGATVGFLFIDLDDFKPVNDKLGHAAGDSVLIAVGRRLAHCIRDEDTVARMGGDEFAVLLRSIAGPGGVAEIEQRISDTIAEPFVVGKDEVRLTASVGSVTTTGGDHRIDELLQRADEAMYAVKRDRHAKRKQINTGNNYWGFFRHE